MSVMVSFEGSSPRRIARLVRPARFPLMAAVAITAAFAATVTATRADASVVNLALPATAVAERDAAMAGAVVRKHACPCFVYGEHQVGAAHRLRDDDGMQPDVA